MFEPVRGAGIYLYDSEENPYTDLISGIGVSALGYSHPKVVKAIQEQAERYLHTMVYGEHVQLPQVAYATKLAKHLPEPLDSVYFTNSGTEAVEGAMKLARKYTGRYEIIACRNAYHGSTYGAMSLMSDSTYNAPFRLRVPGIRFMSFNSMDDVLKITRKTAAVILETIQGEAGYIVPDPEFLHALRLRCAATGTLFVLDEIQCGMGRTGKFLACDHYGIVPDILLLAKAFGGGLPLGAFIASKELMGALSENPTLGHITTFGGNPLCCAAGLAAYEALLEEGHIEKVSGKERLFRSLLKHESIKMISGKGLMLSVELQDADAVLRFVNKCFEISLLTDWFLFKADAFRIAPPLIISENEIEQICNQLIEVLDAIG